MVERPSRSLTTLGGTPARSEIPALHLCRSVGFSESALLFLPVLRAEHRRHRRRIALELTLTIS